MSRLIDADEYEKRIKPYDTEDVMDKALYNFAHNHLVTTPTAQQWTPCSERPPKEKLDVLLQFETGSMCVGFTESGSWWINCGADWCTVVQDGDAVPVAWRELPEQWEVEHE